MVFVGAVAWSIAKNAMENMHVGKGAATSGPMLSSFLFGEVEPGVLVKHTFTLTNTDNRPITVRQIKSPCSCTSASIDRKTLKSLESATVAVVFNTMGWYDEVQKDVVVETDSPVKPLTIFRLEGVVRFPLAPRFPSIHFDYRKEDVFKKVELTVITSGIAKYAVLTAQGEKLRNTLKLI